MKKFSDYVLIRRLLKTKLDIEDFKEINWVRKLAFKRFPILVLVNLEGTLLFRTKGENLLKSDLEYFETGQGKFVTRCYFQPGYDAFLKILLSHKRVHLALYSSKARQNVEPIRDYICSKNGFKTQPHIFDMSHCTPLIEHPDL